MAAVYSTPSLPRPVYEYFKPPLRQQGAIGLAKLPAEVKRMIARECHAQDRAVATLDTDKMRTRKWVDFEWTVACERGLQKHAHSVKSLYAVSREWRTIAAPFRFSRMTNKVVHYFMRAEFDAMLEEKGVHFRTLELNDLEDDDFELLEAVRDSLPHIDRIDMSSEWGLADCAEQSLPSLFARARSLVEADDRSLRYCVELLSRMPNLRHADFAIRFEKGHDLQDLWRLSQRLPDLTSLRLCLTCPPRRPLPLEAFVPTSDYRFPALSHLDLEINLSPGQLDVFGAFSINFAPTLVSLTITLSGLPVPAGNFRPPDGNLFPLLGKLEIRGTWAEACHIFQT